MLGMNFFSVFLHSEVHGQKFCELYIAYGLVVASCYLLRIFVKRDFE